MTALANQLFQSFVTHADIGHLALLMWALGSSALVAFAVREAADAARRSDNFMQEFLHELSHFNHTNDEVKK
jgi:hypothetical protein